MIRLTRSCTALSVLFVSGAGFAQTTTAPAAQPAASSPAATVQLGVASQAALVPPLPPPPSRAGLVPPPPPPPPPVTYTDAPPPFPPPPPGSPAAGDPDGEAHHGHRHGRWQGGPAEPSEWKFELHGVAGVSFYVQDTPQFVLNGQGPLLALGEPGGNLTTGADIRQSRFNFSVAGPRVIGAVPKAVLEIDLFGLNSPGGYGEVSVYSRVRLAYAEMSWHHDVLRLGQDHELILFVPDSVGHMAYPVTYFNGMIGWREPGVGYFHTIPVDRSKLELAVQVIESDWQNPADFGSATTQDLNVDYGQLSGWPGGEARVKFTSEHVMAFVAGHFNHVAGSQAGNLLVPPTTTLLNGTTVSAVPTRDWNVAAGVAAIKLTGGGFSLAVSAYGGKNLGPLLGDLLQFPSSNDVREWGGWAQLGYDVLRHLNLSVIGGIARPNDSDLKASLAGCGPHTFACSVRSASSMFGGMVRYQRSGFMVGPEFYHVVVKNIDQTGNGAPSGQNAVDGIVDANQFMLSGMYQF